MRNPLCARQSLHALEIASKRVFVLRIGVNASAKIKSLLHAKILNDGVDFERVMLAQFLFAHQLVGIRKLKNVAMPLIGIGVIHCYRVQT